VARSRARRMVAAGSAYFARRSIFIDDDRGATVVSASSLEKTALEGLKTGASVAAAKAVGKLIAQRAQEKGVKNVIFDRGSYLFHGRVRALAEAAREGGLSF
jgi:large subunit ribosomal protein L18